MQPSLLIAVAAGGAVGAVGRYLVVSGIGHWIGQGFPWGTLAVNVLGCFGIGFLAALGDARLTSEGVRLFLMVGLLGGFTTFSALGFETFALWRDGDAGRALANALVHLVLGLAAVTLGWSLAATR